MHNSLTLQQHQSISQWTKGSEGMGHRTETLCCESWTAGGGVGWSHPAPPIPVLCTYLSLFSPCLESYRNSSSAQGNVKPFQVARQFLGWKRSENSS